MKNSNDTNGNRTRDLPTCSAVPQPTALRRAPIPPVLSEFISMDRQTDWHEEVDLLKPKTYFMHRQL